jgi:hypothetical protein
VRPAVQLLARGVVELEHRAVLVCAPRLQRLPERLHVGGGVRIQLHQLVAQPRLAAHDVVDERVPGTHTHARMVKRARASDVTQRYVAASHDSGSYRQSDSTD